jgi:tryptophan synthase alpha chain
MNGSGRIEEVFARCRRERRAGFIPYITAGDPSLARTGDLLDALVGGGADIIELGVPFSDPIADGPVNQRSACRALEAGTTFSGILELIASRRNRMDTPIVLFTYFNPIYARGVEAFAEQAAASGVDGVLCLDVPPEEGEQDIFPALRQEGIDPIFLLSPTSTKERIDKVAGLASGFVYYVSRTGVTGERATLPDELAAEVRRIKKRIRLPLAVGFGISTPEQVAAVAALADGVVVGSALVRLIEENASNPRLPALLEARVAELSAPLREPRRRRLALPWR